MPERTTTRGLDPEITAMAKIDQIMTDLKVEGREGAVARVLTWLCDRHAPEEWGFYPGGEREPRP